MRAYPELKGSDRVSETCARCGGHGRIESFGHVMAGLCFECNGHGAKTVLVSSVRAREARQAKQASEARKREQQVQEIWQALRVDHNDLWHLLQDRQDHPFVASVANQINSGKVPSDKQLKALERFAPEPEPLPVTPVPEGRHQVTGEVVSTRWDSGYYGEVLKMLVQDDQGYRVWGSVPQRLLDVEPGDRITFAASLQRSETDQAYGFFKRPTKPERV